MLFQSNTINLPMISKRIFFLVAAIFTIFYCVRKLPFNVSRGITNGEQFLKPNVYLVETSGKNFLDNRQLASLESVARFVQHDKVIVLMFTEQPIKYSYAMTALNSTYGISFEKASFLPFFVGTPLESWYNNTSLWKSGKYRTEHISDAMRGALMWKFGGIFMDLDIIMIKETRFSRPSVVWEPESSLASFFMAFNSHHELMRLFVTEFNRTYNPEIYHVNGPVLFTNVYRMYKQWIKETGRTDDVLALQSDVMSTAPSWSGASKFFDESATKEMLKRETKNTVGVHIWNSRNKDMKVKANSSCAYIHYVKKSSPIVYAEMVKAGTV